MKNFTLSVTWMMSGTVTVKAESLYDAIEMASDAPLPTDGDYVPDSFCVDESCADEEEE